jgi:diphosphomevalonate decarboxylase
MTTATARAYPNMALVKYWGKRDAELMLPLTGSLSMTLDAYPTTTTVTLAPDATDDVFELNGAEVDGEPRRRVVAFLDLVRERSGRRERAIVRSHNEVPTAAGLASSATGFAALALAAAQVYGLSTDPASVRRLARRGSGSATRSVIDSMAVWHAGTDDESSFAERVEAPEIRMVVVVLDAGNKEISSREAMRRTIATSPYLDAWVTSTEASLTEMLDACAAGDFTRMGEITELSAMRMHAAIQACDPPIRYLAPSSIAVFEKIRALRDGGIEAYGTADAGPNVVAITRPGDAERVAEALAEYGPVRIVGPGPGAHLLDSDEDGQVAR